MYRTLRYFTTPPLCLSVSQLTSRFLLTMGAGRKRDVSCETERQKGGVVKYRSVRYIFYVVVKFINLRFIIRIKLVLFYNSQNSKVAQVRLSKLKPDTSSFGGRKNFTGQTVFFFRASARKTKNKNSSHGTRAIRWASADGSFFCLWAVRAHSARGRALTEPWATPPTAGAMKI